MVLMLSFSLSIYYAVSSSHGKLAQNNVKSISRIAKKNFRTRRAILPISCLPHCVIIGAVPHAMNGHCDKW